MGERPAVGSSSLDGEDRAVVVSTGLLEPSGVTVDYAEGRLYWCDSKMGVIEEAGLDGSNRRVLVENQVGEASKAGVLTGSGYPRPALWD